MHKELNIIISLLIFNLLVIPAYAQVDVDQTWTLPGTGAGYLEINPADGSIWTFMHQTGNLVSLDPVDGSVLVDVPLTIYPTAMTFAPDGSYGIIVGEPQGDQLISNGLIQIFNPSDGSILMEANIEGACNAVYSADFTTFYVACGMQYAYQGIVYRFNFVADGDELMLEMDGQAECGKIPWAIGVYDDVLYVTDLELQWTAQPDGSIGPPYGSYVWAYDTESMEPFDAYLVGINPSDMDITAYGVLIACSGSKQGQGDQIEPAVCLLDGDGDVGSINIGTAGASDLAVSPDGTWAVISLADWGPPAEFSAMAVIQELRPGMFDDARRWTYTGDIAIVDLTDDYSYEISGVTEDGFLRSVAVSPDGTAIYALNGETDEIHVINAG